MEWYEILGELCLWLTGFGCGGRFMMVESIVGIMVVGGKGNERRIWASFLFPSFLKSFFFIPFFSKNHILRIITAIMIGELTEQCVENNKIKN